MKGILENKKLIIWDWNGTLLDDVEICITSMNKLLALRGLPLLTRKKYRQIFTFPVREYYKQAGFDFTKEPFEKPAMEFIGLYHSLLTRARLHKDSRQILEVFRTKGYHQIVLSAMEKDSLVSSLKSTGIHNLFQAVYGIDNHYADGKLELARRLLKEQHLSSRQMLIVGDSLHDLEVGKKTGIDVLLVAQGHQSAERLRAATGNVIKSLNELMTLIY